MSRHEILPGTPEYAILARAVRVDAPVTIVTIGAWSEAVFEPGDRVRVHFDDGPGPAEVTGSYRDRYDGTHRVQVKYGPSGRYTTTLAASSVSTSHRIEHPATITLDVALGMEALEVGPGPEPLDTVLDQTTHRPGPRTEVRMDMPRAGTLRELALLAFHRAYLAGREGLTDAQLSEQTETYLYSIAPRRGELVTLGWVEDSGMTRVTERGRDAIVWRLTIAGVDKLDHLG